MVTAYLDRTPANEAPWPACWRLWTPAPSNRTTLPAHITCSAVVIDRHRRVLHIRHKAGGRLLLAPGGHVEADDTLLAAALREVKEEAGIPASALVLTPELRDEPINVDVHAIDPDPARGEAAHWHYGVRFVFCLVDRAPELALQAEEVTGSAWLPSDEVSSPTLREKLADSALDGVIVAVNASAIIHDGNGRYLLRLRDANRPWVWESGCWNGDPARLPLTGGVMLAGMRPERFPHMTMLPSTRELLERHAAEHPAPAHRPVAAGGTTSSKAPSGTVLNVVGVHLHLERDGQVLFGLRHPGSACAGGSWHVLAGHCERRPRPHASCGKRTRKLGW